MKRTIHQLTQGAPDWLAHRALILNASEAPAVVGASKYLTRGALLAQKATGIVPEVNAAKQALFDRGHAVEGPTVALIEEDIGDSLAPVVASIEIDGLTLGASYDGLTLMEDTGAEVKLWNEDLAEQIRRREIEPHYYWQLEQQFIVTPSLERIIFATSDGTRERFVSMEYRPVPGRREQLLAAWKQFQRDRAAYTPPEVVDVIPITPRGPDQLPALRSNVTGSLVLESNIKEWEEAALAYIKSVRDHDLKTDEDFANADAAAKWCDTSKTTLLGVRVSLMSATGDVNMAVATLDRISAELDKTRIAFTNAIKARKEARKREIVEGGIKALADHVAALNQRLGRPYMPPQSADFAGCLKNMRSLANMEDAVAVTLANAKIAANETADRIDANLKALREQADGYQALFPDTAQLVLKAPDDCRAVITSRIAEHRAAEERRAAELAERERERIRAEEQAKAQREATAAQRAAAASAPTIEAQPPAAAPIAAPAVSSQAANVVPMGTRAPAKPTTPPTLKLGDLNARIAPLRIDAEGLKSLGFEPAGRERSALLFHEAQFGPICAALVSHLTAVAEQRAAA